MAQSLSKVLLHLVFSTKQRLNSIPADLLVPVHTCVAEICRECGSEAFRIGGTQNHIHIACTLPRVVTIAELVRETKQNSCRWLKKVSPQSHTFSWQQGYGVFSVSPSQLETLRRYIEGQAAHHRVQTYTDELLEILRRYEVEYDERYLWD